MKKWNIPEVQELDVKMTASSGVPSTSEAAGYLSNGWNNPTFNSSLYEHSGGDCVIPRKDRAAS